MKNIKYLIKILCIIPIILLSMNIIAETYKNNHNLNLKQVNAPKLVDAKLDDHYKEFEYSSSNKNESEVHSRIPSSSDDKNDLKKTKNINYWKYSPSKN